MWEHLWDGRGGRSEKAFITHLFLLASAGDLGGSICDTIAILWSKPRALLAPRPKKTWATSGERPGFQEKHPLNFISHYISNLITWWNVTPAGVLGCWDRAEACGQTWGARSAVELRRCYRWRIGWSPELRPSGLPASRESRDLPESSSSSHELSGCIKGDLQSFNGAFVPVLWS